MGRGETRVCGQKQTLIMFDFTQLIAFCDSFRLTRRVPLVEQERFILMEYLSSPPVFSGACVTRSSLMCMFCRSLFVLLLLAIVLSVLLRLTDLLAHLAKGNVSFCHHLASVVCRPLTFPLKPLS